MESTEKVVLPDTIHDLHSKHFPESSKADIFRLSCGYNTSTFTPAQKIVWKYSGGALLAGRPLDSAIIFMAGVTGSGKSSTINALFEDATLCKTYSHGSNSDHVTLVRKPLCVTSESPAVQGYLSFVDVPGTDEAKEAQNMANIRKFKTSRIEFADRYDTQLKFTSVRKSVYPNIVLFVVNATDIRIDGNDSHLAKSLRAFEKTTNLMDPEKNNVIVVLTHVLSLGINKKKFGIKLAEKQKIIKNQFSRILKINDVEVIPVENKPEDFDGSDSETSYKSAELIKRADFYKLPNGERSHQNLFEAMLRRFDNNQDLLGRLLVSSYFMADCPEKGEAAEITVFDEPPTDLEMANWTKEPEILQIPGFPGPERKAYSPGRSLGHSVGNCGDFPSTETLGGTIDMENSPMFYNFQNLSRGYCPVTEEIKSNSPVVCNQGETKLADIGYHQFRVHEWVEVFANRESRSQRLTFLEKEEYEEHMKKRYEIDAGFKLVVKTNPEERWLNTGMETKTSCLFSVVQEIQIAECKLSNPNNCTLSPEFERDLNNLPKEYSEATKDQFCRFFANWGTHLIAEQAFGGAVQLSCIIDKPHLTRKQFQHVEVAVLGLFRSLFSNEDISNPKSKLRNLGVTIEHLRITGGDPPIHVNWDTISPKILQDWAKTVDGNPAQLRGTMKLYPYYSFGSADDQYFTLRQATKDYLSGNLSLDKKEKETELKEDSLQNGKKKNTRDNANADDDDGSGCCSCCC